MGDFVDSLDVGDDALTVRQRDGRETPVPFLWLRNNCDCGDCRIEQTSEKRFHLFAVDKHLRPHQAHVVAGADDESIRLVWPDGHQTRYRAMDLLALLAPVRPKIEYWDCRFRPQHFDCGDFRGDDHAVAALIEEFPATGACVLTHGPTEPGSVEKLASRLGPVREVVFERIHNVEIDPKGYNIAHTNVDVPPHNDLVSYTQPPSVQALHMLANACEGGDSVIVDGFAVVERLRLERPEMLDVLCAVPVPFRLFSDDNETYSINPMIELDSAGEIARPRYSNQTTQAVPLSEPRSADFYGAYHELAARINDDGVKDSLRLEGARS